MCAQKEREDRRDEEEGDQGHDLPPAGGGGGISAGVHAKISAREVRGEHSHGHNQGESRVRRRRDVQVHRCLTSDIYIYCAGASSWVHACVRCSGVHDCPWHYGLLHLHHIPTTNEQAIYCFKLWYVVVGGMQG